MCKCLLFVFIPCRSDRTQGQWVTLAVLAAKALLLSVAFVGLMTTFIVSLLWQNCRVTLLDAVL